jgi:SET and MYND domain-containing protein
MAEFAQWHSSYPVRVNKHPYKGRQMIASRDVEANEVLLADSPYCWIVDDSAKTYVCQNCFLEKDDDMQAFLGCSDCCQVWYCSEECKSTDYLQHNQDECAIFKAMETEEYSSAIITEMKLLVRTISRKSLEVLFEENGETVDENGQSPMPNDNGLRYKDYASLITNRENFPQATIESLDYWICDYIRRLGEWVGGRTETNIELLDILLRNRCNAFYIQGRLRDVAVAQGMVGQSRGCGIYVRNSFFNHSCQPNVNYWVVENSLRVECTASVPVKKGEELNISYIDTAQDLAARREKLLESYLFTCDCARCTREEAGEIDGVAEVEGAGAEEGGEEEVYEEEEAVQVEDPDDI